jgi:hypothetical protein
MKKISLLINYRAEYAMIRSINDNVRNVIEHGWKHFEYFGNCTEEY